MRCDDVEWKIICIFSLPPPHTISFPFSLSVCLQLPLDDALIHSKAASNASVSIGDESTWMWMRMQSCIFRKVGKSEGGKRMVGNMGVAAVLTCCSFDCSFIMPMPGAGSLKELCHKLTLAKMSFVCIWQMRCLISHVACSVLHVACVAASSCLATLLPAFWAWLYLYSWQLLVFHSGNAPTPAPVSVSVCFPARALSINDCRQRDVCVICWCCWLCLRLCSSCSTHLEQSALNAYLLRTLANT